MLSTCIWYHSINRFFTEDVPLLCWWWDLFMNMALVKTTTFHSALTVSERDNVVKDFNKIGVALGRYRNPQGRIARKEHQSSPDR